MAIEPTAGVNVDQVSLALNALKEVDNMNILNHLYKATALDSSGGEAVGARECIVYECEQSAPDSVTEDFRVANGERAGETIRGVKLESTMTSLLQGKQTQTMENITNFVAAQQEVQTKVNTKIARSQGQS